MTNKIVFATNNKNKLEEVRAIINPKFRILGLADIDCFEDIPEDQETLEGNAKQKAQYIHEKYNINCFADDTGLEVDALNGEPGVYSARYAGEDKDSNKNMEKLLFEMQNKPTRTAKFRTVISLILDNKEYMFEGEVKGIISKVIKGKNGFGYDPIFIPDGFNKTFAELSKEIKNSISHRAIATDKMLKFLKNYTK